MKKNQPDSAQSPCSDRGACGRSDADVLSTTEQTGGGGRMEMNRSSGPKDNMIAVPVAEDRDSGERDSFSADMCNATPTEKSTDLCDASARAAAPDPAVSDDRDLSDGAAAEEEHTVGGETELLPPGTPGAAAEEQHTVGGEAELLPPGTPGADNAGGMGASSRAASRRSRLRSVPWGLVAAILFNTVWMLTVYEIAILRLFTAMFWIYFAALAGGVLAYVVYNRGFSRLRLTEDDLPRSWSASEKAAFLAEGQQRLRRSRWALAFLIPLLITFLYDMTALFFGDFFENLLPGIRWPR